MKYIFFETILTQNSPKW